VKDARVHYRRGRVIGGKKPTRSLYAAVNTWKAASTRGEATAGAGDARAGAQQATSTRREADA
jgi:hypothetical protein